MASTFFPPVRPSLGSSGRLFALAWPVHRVPPRGWGRGLPPSRCPCRLRGGHQSSSWHSYPSALPLLSSSGQRPRCLPWASQKCCSVTPESAAPPPQSSVAARVPLASSPASRNHVILGTVCSLPPHMSLSLASRFLPKVSLSAYCLSLLTGASAVAASRP